MKRMKAIADPTPIPNPHPKQAKGKKRMKAIGSVNVPQEAFMAVLKLNDD
jgi:hypothetical protein